MRDLTATLATEVLKNAYFIILFSMGFSVTHFRKTLNFGITLQIGFTCVVVLVLAKTTGQR